MLTDDSCCCCTVPKAGESPRGTTTDYSRLAEEAFFENIAPGLRVTVLTYYSIYLRSRDHLILLINGDQKLILTFWEQKVVFKSSISSTISFGVTLAEQSDFTIRPGSTGIEVRRHQVELIAGKLIKVGGKTIMCRREINRHINE